MECWEDMDYRCPVQGCNHDHSVLDYKLYKNEEKPTGVTCLPESKGFLDHWMTKHRPMGTASISPANMRIACQSVPKLTINYATHLKAFHKGEQPFFEKWEA